MLSLRCMSSIFSQEEMHFAIKSGFREIGHPLVSRCVHTVSEQLKDCFLSRWLGRNFCLRIKDRQQCVKVCVREIDPVAFPVGVNFLKPPLRYGVAYQKLPLLIRLRVIAHGLVEDPAALDPFLLDAEVHGDTDPDLVVEDVSAFLPATLAAGAGVALEIYDPDFVEFTSNDFA